MTLITNQQAEALRRAGERLAAELHRVFEAVAPRNRTVREVASALDIDRNIAQRALAAAQPPVDGLQVFIRMPGARSLRLLVERVRKSKKGASLASALEAAVNEVENQIQTVAGHQARLRAMIKAQAEGAAITSPSDGFGPAVRARMQAYESAVNVSGCHSDLNLSIRVHRPTPGDPKFTECATVKAILGLRSRPGGMAYREESMSVFGRHNEPLIPDDSAAVLRSDSPSNDPLGESESLLRVFSTPNVPISAVKSPSGLESHIVEPSATLRAPGVDIVTARRHGGISSPLTDPELTHISMVAHPTKRLLLDVYLHRDLASQASAYFGGYVWTPSVARDIQSAWPDRIPGTPPLAMLGRGIGHCECDAWARHAELTKYTFDRLGWDPSEYVGFRGDVVYPIWAAKYVVVFAFDPLGS